MAIFQRGMARDSARTKGPGDEVLYGPTLFGLSPGGLAVVRLLPPTIARAFPDIGLGEFSCMLAVEGEAQPQPQAQDKAKDKDGKGPAKKGDGKDTAGSSAMAEVVGYSKRTPVPVCGDCYVAYQTFADSLLEGRPPEQSLAAIALRFARLGLKSVHVEAHRPGQDHSAGTGHRAVASMRGRHSEAVGSRPTSGMRTASRGSRRERGSSAGGHRGDRSRQDTTVTAASGLVDHGLESLGSAVEELDLEAEEYADGQARPGTGPSREAYDTDDSLLLPAGIVPPPRSSLGSVDDSKPSSPPAGVPVSMLSNAGFVVPPNAHAIHSGQGQDVTLVELHPAHRDLEDEDDDDQTDGEHTARSSVDTGLDQPEDGSSVAMSADYGYTSDGVGSIEGGAPSSMGLLELSSGTGAAGSGDMKTPGSRPKQSSKQKALAALASNPLAQPVSSGHRRRSPTKAARGGSSMTASGQVSEDGAAASGSLTGKSASRGRSSRSNPSGTPSGHGRSKTKDRPARPASGAPMSTADHTRDSVGGSRRSSTDMDTATDDGHTVTTVEQPDGHEGDASEGQSVAHGEAQAEHPVAMLRAEPQADAAAESAGQGSALGHSEAAAEHVLVAVEAPPVADEAAQPEPAAATTAST